MTGQIWPRKSRIWSCSAWSSLIFPGYKLWILSLYLSSSLFNVSSLFILFVNMLLLPKMCVWRICMFASSSQILCGHYAVGKSERASWLWASAPRRWLHRGHWIHDDITGMPHCGFRLTLKLICVFSNHMCAFSLHYSVGHSAGRRSWWEVKSMSWGHSHHLQVNPHAGGWRTL